ncbi:MAG: hypothetical protein Kow00123_23090 [Anaerolineales bacterium]
MLRSLAGVFAFLWGILFLVWPLPEPEIGPGTPSIYVRLVVFVALVVIGLEFIQPSVVRSWKMLPLAVRLLPLAFFGLMVILDITTTGFQAWTLFLMGFGLKLVEMSMPWKAPKQGAGPAP